MRQVEGYFIPLQSQIKVLESKHQSLANRLGEK